MFQDAFQADVLTRGRQLAAIALVIWCAAAGGEEPVKERFPPLVVPEGFKATLYAADPLVEYLSVIAIGPQPHTLFVAHDYMTGLGFEIVRRDEIRLLRDSDRDGKADESLLYAEGFNSIQGLAYHDGTVYAMHAPLLTALKDTDGDGKADERKDLLSGLGLLPEKNQTRLHCANGVAVGHDGWLYLALGDNGVDVQRPEGDRLVFEGGGILRCRPDGRDLHVFSTGLRNIYDVALDDQGNVFVRDNENDGGDYMIRVCHSFFGADHGYPYLYYEHPDEALRPLADLGRGSSAGVVCYLGSAFPAEMRGNLFCCEWGRAIVRYPLEPSGSGFAPTKEVDFASGAANDPYGFKPTDLIVDHDGSLLISDWCDGQRPKRGRGRIYRIAYVGQQQAGPAPRARPDVEKHSIDELLRFAQSDADPEVRIQAIRAIADLTDPVLVQHKLDAGRGDAALAERIAGLASGQEPRVLLEIVLALGRLRWPGTPGWLAKQIDGPDDALAHAAMQALRRSNNWPEVLKLVDGSDRSLRPIALRAAADRSDAVLVDGLIERLAHEGAAARRREYAELLSRVYKQPGPWTYWGYRPAPRPANTVAWDRSEQIEQALDRVLSDTDREVRTATLPRMLREQIPLRTSSLAAWLNDERGKDRVAELLSALKRQPPGEAIPLWDTIVRTREHDIDNRLTAMRELLETKEPRPAGWMHDLLAALEDGPVLAELLRSSPAGLDAKVLLGKLKSDSAVVREAAIRTLARRKVEAAADRLSELLQDEDPAVVRAAAAAAGTLRASVARGRLLDLARGRDAELSSLCLDSLRELQDDRGLIVALTALERSDSQRAALDYLARFGSAEHAEAVVKLAGQTRSHEIVAAAIEALSAWDARDAIARVHGISGVVLHWKTSAEADRWAVVSRADAEGRVELKQSGEQQASAEVIVPEATRVEFLAAASGALRVQLNDTTIYEAEKPAKYQADSVRFSGELQPGRNRLLVRIAGEAAPVQFHLRFRRISSSAEHERLTQHLLQTAGNADRGGELFWNNAEKSLCTKCHRVGDKGGRIGPDLTGIGSRFSRIHLIESILDPSRTIAPSYETIVVALASGRTVSGVKVVEDEQRLTLGDNEGRVHEIAKSEIEERQTQTKSIMPDGMEKRLSDRELADLLAFLLARKKAGP